jgi:hypothetical protein
MSANRDVTTLQSAINAAGHYTPPNNHEQNDLESPQAATRP